MPGTGDVLVVGDLLVDVVVVPNGPLVRGSDTAATIRSMGGGAAANTASWLAHGGCDVRLVAAVGDDALGRTAMSEMAEIGVRWAGQVVAAQRTGSCVVLVDTDGERTMLPDRGANDVLSGDAVRQAFAQPAAWLHLSGYTLLGEGSRAAGRAAVEAALAHDVPFSVDAASAAPLEQVGAERFLEWVEGCTVLFANDDEITALGGIEAALKRCREVVTKHGPRGSSWTDGLAEQRAPAVPVRLVDTVGAGDAFDAGYIDAAVSGAEPREALEAAARVAAAAVSKAGARP